METSTEVDMVEEVSVVAEGDERLVSKTAGPIGALYFLPQHKHDQANSRATGCRPVSRNTIGRRATPRRRAMSHVHAASTVESSLALAGPSHCDQ